jgi:hypothetical protein
MADESMDAFERLHPVRNDEALKRQTNKMIYPELAGSSSFETFMKKYTRQLVQSGMGAPSGMADGKTMGAHSRPSHEALAATAVELWQQNDRDENAHLAKIACYFATANALKYRHVPFPDSVTRKIVSMGLMGLLAEEFTQEPPFATHTDADLKFGDEVSDGDDLMKELQSALVKKNADLVLEKDKVKIMALQAEIEGLRAQIQAVNDASAARFKDKAHTTPDTRTSSGSGGYTLPPRTASEQAQQISIETPRTLGDSAALAKLRRGLESIVRSLHDNFPLVTARVCPLGPVKVEHMQPQDLNDVIFQLRSQQQVFNLVMGTFAQAARKGIVAPLAAIKGRSADITFASLIDDKVIVDKMSPHDRLFALIQVGDLAVALLKLYFVPTPTVESKQLLDLCKRIHFHKEGHLDISGASSQLLSAVADSGAEETDNDYDKVMRELVGALAATGEMAFSADDNGSKFVWPDFVSEMVDAQGARGTKPYNYVEFTNFMTKITKIGRLQITRQIATKSAISSRAHSQQPPSVLTLTQHGGQADEDYDPELTDDGFSYYPYGSGSLGGGALDYTYVHDSRGGDAGYRSWYDASDDDQGQLVTASQSNGSALTPAVLAVLPSDKTVCVNVSCGHGLRRSWALCGRCGAAQGSTWLCFICKMLTKDEDDLCAHGNYGGCPGTKTGSRAPTRAEVLALANVKLERGKGAGKGHGGKGNGKGSVAPAYGYGNGQGYANGKGYGNEQGYGAAPGYGNGQGYGNSKGKGGGKGGGRGGKGRSSDP